MSSTTQLEPRCNKRSVGDVLTIQQVNGIYLTYVVMCDRLRVGPATLEVWSWISHKLGKRELC
jgi:hypothetical protein